MARRQMRRRLHGGLLRLAAILMPAPLCNSLQAFSIPGSMYMSILAGAMWGVPLALPIVCAVRAL